MNEYQDQAWIESRAVELEILGLDWDTAMDRAKAELQEMLEGSL